MQPWRVSESEFAGSRALWTRSADCLGLDARVEALYCGGHAAGFDDCELTGRSTISDIRICTAIAKQAASKGKAPKKKQGSSAVSAAKGPTRALEVTLWDKGIARVAGVDEAGRGPLAGPVVAAAVVLPRDYVPSASLNDSKQMSEGEREAVFEALMADKSVTKAVSVISAKTIDEINILQATLKGMRESCGALKPKAQYALIDGNKVPDEMESVCEEGAHAVVKGDTKSLAISAASVLAKVTRDRMCVEMDAKWPQYGFAGHKGYPTAAHRAALMQHGPCPEHRRSYTPVAQAEEKHAKKSKNI